MVPARKTPLPVVIQTFANNAGAWNDVKAWSQFAAVWVSISPDRGREIEAADETVATVTHTIRGDFYDLEGVSEKMRVIYSPKGVYDPIPNDAEVYDILAVMPDEDTRQDIMLKAQLNSRRYGELK